MDLNPIAETKMELLHYFKELEALDSNPLNIPVKILKWYIHHFNPQNLIQTCIDYNPWPYIKPYVMPIIDYFWGPQLWWPEGRPMENGFEEDEFGFKKIIFGLTSDHKTVSAITTKTGYTEWNINYHRKLEELKFISENIHLVYSKLFVLEKDEKEDDLVILYQNSANQSLILECTPSSGIVWTHRIYDKTQIKDAFKLHLSSMHEIIIIIDQNSRVQTFPKILST